MSKRIKYKNQNLIFVVISIIIIVIIYTLIQIVLFLKKPTNLTLIKNGELIKYEEVEGYIIRDETIIDTSKYSGTPNITISDANRVAKGSTIISYISNSQESLIKKITQLDEKIQKALEEQKTTYSADVKELESTIQYNLYEMLKYRSDVYEISEFKSTINEKIEKKAKIVGELSPTGSLVKSLIDERLEYEKELNNSRQELISPAAGLVSYRVDNLENILTPNSFTALSIEKLENLRITLGQIIPINTSTVKIIDNFSCYIAIPMYSEESKNLSLNSTVKLRINNNENYIKATVSYISEEKNARLVILKITNNIEELTKYRKIELDVIWWSDTGLKVPTNAIKEKDIYNSNNEKIATISAVTVQEAGYKEDIWIKIIRESGNFAIIENYSDEELLELGIDKNQINNNGSISLYDEIIIYD